MPPPSPGQIPDPSHGAGPVGCTPYKLSSGSVLRRIPWDLCCVFQYGRTPLHLAANNGILDVVRYLCLTGANVEALTSVSSPRQEEAIGNIGGRRERYRLAAASEADRLLLGFSPPLGAVHIRPHRPRVMSSHCSSTSLSSPPCRACLLLPTACVFPCYTTVPLPVGLGVRVLSQMPPSVRGTGGAMGFREEGDGALGG